MIRLTELEIINLNNNINGRDELAKDDAGEMLIQFDALATKLKDMYELIYTEESAYPLYSDFIDRLHNNEN